MHYTHTVLHIYIPTHLTALPLSLYIPTKTKVTHKRKEKETELFLCVCGVCVNIVLFVFVMAKKFWSLKKVMSKELRPGKFFPTFKWKRLDFQMAIVDGVVFKIVSVVEAVVLVSTLCFFYLCCGCHIWFLFLLFHRFNCSFFLGSCCVLSWFWFLGRDYNIFFFFLGSCFCSHSWWYNVTIICIWSFINLYVFVFHLSFGLRVFF